MNFMNEDWCVFWWNMSLNVSTSPVSQVWFCVIQAPFHICLYLRMLCEQRRKKTNERTTGKKRKQRKSNSSNRESTRQQALATLALVHSSHFRIYCLFFIVARNPLQLHSLLPTIPSFMQARMSNDLVSASGWENKKMKNNTLPKQQRGLACLRNFVKRIEKDFWAEKPKS